MRTAGLGICGGLMLMLGITAAQAADTPAPEVRERSLRQELAIAVPDLPTDLNPLFATTPVAAFINGFIRRPLTAFDADWRLVCLICVDIPTVENGKAQIAADGSMTVTFTLLPEVRWGDGTPLTTRDVLFSWQALQTQPQALAIRPWVRAVSSLVAEDERTFTLRWRQPRLDYNQLNDFPILPEHVERLAFRNPLTYRQSSRFALNPLDAGLGNGPYQLVAQDADSLTLAISPTWWRTDRPAFTRITLHRLPDRAAVAEALSAGTVDLLPPGLSLGFEDIATLQDTLDLPDSTVVYASGTALEQIAFNLDNPVLQDVRVRRALLYALDRAALNAVGLRERYQLADGFVSHRDPVFVGKDLPRYDFDPDRAARLLDAAGWIRRADGYRYNAAGERLRFDFTTSVRQPVRGLIQQVASNSWRAVGVEVVIDNVDQHTLVHRVLPMRAFTGVVLYSWHQLPGALPWFAFHSAAVPEVRSITSAARRGINYAGLRDAQMDAALAALATATGAGARQQAWQVVQKRYLELLPGIPLYFRPIAGVLPKTLHGLTTPGHHAPASFWAEHWYLDQTTARSPIRNPF